MLLRRLPGPRKRVGERERFVYWASLLRTAGKQNKMLLRRLPGPRKRVGEKGYTRTPTQEQKQFLDLTSDVLEHKWRASLKTILFLYEEF